METTPVDVTLGQTTTVYTEVIHETSTFYSTPENIATVLQTNVVAIQIGMIVKLYILNSWSFHYFNIHWNILVHKISFIVLSNCDTFDISCLYPLHSTMFCSSICRVPHVEYQMLTRLNHMKSPRSVLQIVTFLFSHIYLVCLWSMFVRARCYHSLLFCNLICHVLLSSCFLE